MEKIKERNFKFFLIPIVALWSAAILTCLLTLILPMAGVIVSFITTPISVVAPIFALVYGHYFYYRLSLDINAVCKGDGQESESYLSSLALTLLTFGAYKIYWIYKLGTRLRANAPRYGFKMYETGKDIAILTSLSFGYLGIVELIKNMNRIAKIYNKNGLPETIGGVQ